MGTGLKALGEKQVNFSLDGSADGVAGTQADPAVTALSNGDFVVVYENPEAGDNTDLLAHFFDASGNAIGPPVSSGLLNGVVGIDRTVDATGHPAVAATPDGGFLVAYTDTTPTDNSIVVRRYDNTTGISAPFVIDSGAGPMHQPNVGTVDSAAIAGFADGTSVVVWEFDYADSLRITTYTSRFSIPPQMGLPLQRDCSDHVLTFQTASKERPSAASGNIAAIVYAADPGTTTAGQDIILRLFNSSATQVAAPSTIFGAASSDVFSHPDVAALSDGRFVIVAQDDTTSVLVASIFDPVTHAVTPLSNFASVTGTGTSPHVAGAPGGGFIVSFDGPTGDVVEARFGPGGAVLFNAGVANSFTAGTQDQNAIAANASGTAFLAWQDAGSANPNSTDTDTRIEAQAFRLQQLPQPNFNGDSFSDILWQNASGQAAIWEMNGTNVDRRRIGRRQSWPELEGDRNRRLQRRRPFRHPVAERERPGRDLGDERDQCRSRGALVGANPGPSWKEIGTGDFNGDGKSDILWQNASGQAAVWEMNGTNVIGGALVGANPGPSWKEIGTGDFNGDGKSDILWQNTSGQAAIWEMNGTNIIGSALVGANPGPSWKEIGTGDFNGDGYSDILWQNTSGQAAIWEMNGTNIIGSALVGANPGPSWKAIGTRRLQRRRLLRHPVAERQRSGRDLGDERDQRHRQRIGRRQSRAELEGDRRLRSARDSQRVGPPSPFRMISDRPPGTP